MKEKIERKNFIPRISVISVVVNNYDNVNSDNTTVNKCIMTEKMFIL